MQTWLTVPSVRPSVFVALVAYLAIGGVGFASASPLQDITINVVSGQNLELAVGSDQTKDVTVEVLDSGGKPVAGVPVSFVFPGPGRAGGATSPTDQYFATTLTDEHGRTSVRVKPAGPEGTWSLRITAGSKSISVGFTNVIPGTPKSPATAGAAAPPPTPAVKKSHTALIVVIVAAAVGGGAAAALGGKKGSSSSSPSGPTTPSTISLSIGLGNGSFGTPPQH